MRMTNDQIGDLAERVAAVDLTRPVGSAYERPLFRVAPLGGKYPTVDFLVDALDDRDAAIGFFFAQVKGTAASDPPAPRLAIDVRRDRPSRGRDSRMSSPTVDLGSKAAHPAYSEWRGILLAELALARVPGLAVNKQPPGADHGYDFLVATGRGACFFVRVRAFSSMRLDAEDVDASEEWHWRIDASLIRRARESRSPFFLFVFDADTDHGRFLRLDTLAAPGGRSVTIHMPRENTLDRKNLDRIVAELEAA